MNDGIMTEINEMIIEYNTPADPGSGNDDESYSNEAALKKLENRGTIILDATCAPQNISYPKVEELYGEILMSVKALRKDGKGYEYSKIGRIVGLEGKAHGDIRKLFTMAGY